MLPSWIRSRKLIPRPMYFLAIETTRRRLASVSLCLLSSSPASMALARVTSCSALSKATRPISLRYIRTGSSRETESITSTAAIRSSSISTISSKSFSPSETSIPMSRKTLKILKSWSGSNSTSGKPARMSSGLRKPCSLPLTIRASAARTSGSSTRRGLLAASPFLGGAATSADAVASTAVPVSAGGSETFALAIGFLEGSFTRRLPYLQPPRDGVYCRSPSSSREAARRVVLRNHSVKDDPAGARVEKVYTPGRRGPRRRRAHDSSPAAGVFEYLEVDRETLDLLGHRGRHSRLPKPHLESLPPPLHRLDLECLDALLQA